VAVTPLRGRSSPAIAVASRRVGRAGAVTADVPRLLRWATVSIAPPAERVQIRDGSASTQPSALT
jgi:hypothetical protein